MQQQQEQLGPVKRRVSAPPSTCYNLPVATHRDAAVPRPSGRQHRCPSTTEEPTQDTFHLAQPPSMTAGATDRSFLISPRDQWPTGVSGGNGSLMENNSGAASVPTTALGGPVLQRGMPSSRLPRFPRPPLPLPTLPHLMAPPPFFPPFGALPHHPAALPFHPHFNPYLHSAAPAHLAALHAHQKALMGIQRSGAGGGACIPTVGSAEDDDHPEGDHPYGGRQPCAAEHGLPAEQFPHLEEGFESFSALLLGDNDEGGAATAAPNSAAAEALSQADVQQSALPPPDAGGSAAPAGPGYDGQDLDAFMEECILFGVPSSASAPPTAAQGPQDAVPVPASVSSLVPPAKHISSDVAPLALGTEAVVLAALDGDLDLSFLDDDDDLFAGLDL